MIGVKKLFAIMFLLLLLGSFGVMAEEKFDHFTTGFPLTGMHTNVECEACHIKGIFKGTPTQCQGCHNSQIAPGKSAKHIASTNLCDNCHNEFNWENAVLDHGAVMGGCNQCHNGVTATGRPPQHVATAPVQCDGCHGTLAWTPVRFDHDLAIGTCSSCHNGIQSTGKPKDHIVTTSDCDACHTVRGWIPANGFNHENAAGRCNNAGCHSLPSPHIAINGQCDHCHTTAGWKPVNKVDHDFVVGTCASCHEDDFPVGHVAIIQPHLCDACHSANTDWANFNMLDTGHRQLDAPLVVCGDCHAKDYPPDKHIMFDDTQAPWPVADMGFCANACHHYASQASTVPIPYQQVHQFSARDKSWKP